MPLADNIEGPWEYKGLLNEVAGNSTTNHQAIIEYKGNWYFIYHNRCITRWWWSQAVLSV